jgi:isopenicillin-N epimerase
VSARHREHFLLDPQIGYLNHGSYGATPLPVLEKQWQWQRVMETRPVEFHVRRQEQLLREARAPLAAELGTAVSNTAFVTNSTTGINWVAYSLPLGAGDEVLLNQHEYGAVVRCWQTLAARHGFRLVTARHEPGGDLLEALESARTERTRVVVVSHITSPTAQLLPVAEIATWARGHGIWSVVDGAHAPGHIPVNLDALGVDFWVGNLHKWLWAPKGSALLYVAPQCQALIRPLVISWGVDPPYPPSEPEWVAWVQMQATRDTSAFLAAPHGLEYHRQYHEPIAAELCWDRLRSLSERLAELGAVPLPWAPPLKMRAFTWPGPGEPDKLRAWLFDVHRLEVPVYLWDERLLFRVCLQHYVDDAEIERLVGALAALKAGVAPGSL